MAFEEKNKEVHSGLKCANCGAYLIYEPGTKSLKCPYCGTVNEIENSGKPIVSLDYNTFIHSSELPDNATMEANIVQCSNCGATTTLPTNVTADNCPFCANPLVIETSKTKKILKPQYILPFIINKTAAIGQYKKWLGNLWFAPDKLIKNVENTRMDQLKGIYIPYWSFDTETYTEYTGEQGNYYWTTETYTETVNGEEVERTREVQHTAWHTVYGNVQCSFADILVSASKSLPQNIARKLEPWALRELQPYNEKFISGFQSETYQINAENGLETAKQIILPEIRNAILRDIGGDEQSITNYDNQYHHIALKYELLPIWISAFYFENKLYQIVINGCTGEVIGERPYSPGKIFIAVLVGILVLIVLYFIFKNMQAH